METKTGTNDSTFLSMAQREGANESWRAGGYLRLSREDGDKEESDSIANQRELIRAFAGKLSGITLVDSYEDDGYTGVNYERPGFQGMIQDIKSGKINCVIVKDLSRLGRNYIETGKLLERFFPFMGVRFISINDAYDSNNPNPQTDTLIIPFKNLINDAYCADISKKLRSQFEVRRKIGDYIGSFAAYGYKKSVVHKNRLEIDEETAPVVRDIFQWKISGMSQQGIADKLNALGVPSPLEYKKYSGSKYSTAFSANAHTKWNAVAVGRILKNDLYTGVLTQGMSTTPNYKIKHRIKKLKTEWVRVEHAHDSIIGFDDYALVQRLLSFDTRITPGGAGVYLFSGMLYCGDCGRSLVRKPVKNSEYAYYVCSTYKKGECTSHRISEKLLYDSVYAMLSGHIRECLEISRVLDFINDLPLHRLETEKLQKQIDNQDAEIKKLANRRVKLYEDYTDGIINRDEYERFKTIFETRSLEAESALNTLRGELERVIGGGEASLWIDYFKKYNNMQNLTRQAVVELIERINVYEDKRLEVKVRYLAEFEDTAFYIEHIRNKDVALSEDKVVV